MDNEITILIHGFNKGKDDMAFLEMGLNKFGFETISVNLPTTFGTLEECRNSLHLQVNDLIKNHKNVNYIAHSMGGLITRKYIKSINQDNVSKCVFIATPHNGSKLAEIANHIPFYSRIFRPIEGLLPNSIQYNLNKDIKIGLIAGDKNKGIIGKLFLLDKSDGRVEVSSVETQDASEMVVLHFGHKEIHQQHETLLLVKNFLLSGKFANTI